MTASVDNDEEKNYDDKLPTHTVHMRRALNYCQDLNEETMLHLEERLTKKDGGLQQQFNQQQQCDDDLRQSSLIWFHREHVPLSTIPVIDVLDDDNPTNFRRQFHRGNLPCLIMGLDQREFASISEQWTNASLNSSTNRKINRDWFLQHVDADTKIPVQKQQATTDISTLDDEGRAQECETLQWTMQQWIEGLSVSNPEPHLYLKDWHLVQQLKHEPAAVITSSNDMDVKQNDNVLYSVPAIFQHDLLNTFLTRVTNGDYRFVYWGPAGSQTPLHSDVLHSFSWSYNVVGHKRWTFYPPSLDNNDESSLPHNNDPTITTTITQDQYAGECIFVPSGWKHEVVNVEETLSINHNLVTSANVDRLMVSVDTERLAVDNECRAWGIDAWDAREHMLRGCAGLDLTACFFLLLSSLLDAILAFCCKEDDDDDDDCLETHTDIVLLQAALETLLNRNGSVGLSERISAVLENDEKAQQALAMAKQILTTLAVSSSSIRNE